MKRNLLILILALLTCLTSFGQATKRERNLIKQGNEYFNKKQYSKAEESYSRVLEINPNSQIAKYNLGSTMLRQRGGNSEKDVARDSLISRYLSDVGSNTSAPASLRAHSFYNLGKLAYDRQDYANSVNYFKQYASLVFQCATLYLAILMYRTFVGGTLNPSKYKDGDSLSGWVLDNFTGLLLASVMLIGIVMAANSVAKKLFGGE